MKRKSSPVIREITLNGRTVSYELYRGSFKNLNLRVRSDGSVRVSASRVISFAQIEKFLRTNQDFLFRALARAAELERGNPLEETPWRNGGRLPILGRERTVRVVLGNKNEATLGEEEIFVTVRSGHEEEIRTAIRRMMERESEKLIADLHPLVAQAFSARRLPDYEYRFRYMVSMWGSCCPSKNTVTVNKYLICVPQECIEYVLVHEAAHFFEMNHSSAFWQIVEKILPDWRTRRKALKPYGRWLRKL